MKHSLPLRFDYTGQIEIVVLVGCGGTGAQWARAICRIVYDLKARRRHAPRIRFVDPDLVEVRNVGRQLYLSQEIGANKARVLARRFSYSLGLDIESYDEPFDARRHAKGACLICGAVDNHLARLEMAKCNALWLDVGNHRQAGQVILGNSGDRSQVLRAVQGSSNGIDGGQQLCHYLPNAGLLFPTLLEPEKIESAPEIPANAASCAQLVESGEQALLINDLVATIAAQYTYRILNHEGSTTFASFCDLSTLSVRSVPITRDELLVYLKD